MQHKNPHSLAHNRPVSSARSHSVTSHPTLSSFQSVIARQNRTMARSMSAVLVLGFLVVATLCMSEASAFNSKGGLPSADVKLTLKNKCSTDVGLLVAVGKVLNAKKGERAVLGPVKVKLVALNLLRVKLLVFGKNGKLLKLNVVVNLNLSLLGKIVKGVTELLLEVVEEIVEGVEGKVIKLLCGKVVLAKVIVKL